MDHSTSILGIVIPFSVILTSLLGSVHCATMCGGLVMAATSEKKYTLWVYHFSRLFGYLLLGVVAGQFGAGILSSENNKYFVWIATVSISVVLLITGIGILRGRSLHLRIKSISKLVSKIQIFALKQKNHMSRASMVGFFSAFLPCGWLYSFVITAVASQSVYGGGIILFFFWLGTLPALTIGPEVFRKLIAPFIKKSPKVMGFMFIFIAFLLLGFRVLPMQHDVSCHSEQIFMDHD